MSFVAKSSMPLVAHLVLRGGNTMAPSRLPFNTTLASVAAARQLGFARGYASTSHPQDLEKSVKKNAKEYDIAHSKDPVRDTSANNSQGGEPVGQNHPENLKDTIQKGGSGNFAEAEHNESRGALRDKAPHPDHLEKTIKVNATERGFKDTSNTAAQDPDTAPSGTDIGGDAGVESARNGPASTNTAEGGARSGGFAKDKDGGSGKDPNEIGVAALPNPFVRILKIMAGGVGLLIVVKYFINDRKNRKYRRDSGGTASAGGAGGAGVSEEELNVATVRPGFPIGSSEVQRKSEYEGAGNSYVTRKSGDKFSR